MSCLYKDFFASGVRACAINVFDVFSTFDDWL
jgi:hypothetical protein